MVPGAIATSGGACPTTGMIGTDTAGIAYTCQSGVWTTIGECGLGCGQSWHDMSALRTLGTIYINSSGKPIVANVSCNATNIIAWVNGSYAQEDTSLAQNATFIIPNGASYHVWCGGANQGTMQDWLELY